jgi:hypothetical protein
VSAFERVRGNAIYTPAEARERRERERAAVATALAVIVSDEVHDGTRCAICEERIKPGEVWQIVPATGESVHVACWEGEK